MIASVEPLAARHDLSSFRCGNDGLDTWLQVHAAKARGQGVRTYVALGADGALLGYFALTPHAVERIELPPRLARGTPARIPAVLLAKLARDLTYRGSGLGSELLLEALDVIVHAAKLVGGRLVIVDAIDEAAARFYESHDFAPLPGHGDRLILKMSTAARILGITWP